MCSRYGIRKLDFGSLPPLPLKVKLYKEINFFNKTNRENYFEFKLKYTSFEFFCLVF